MTPKREYRFRPGQVVIHRSRRRAYRVAAVDPRTRTCVLSDGTQVPSFELKDILLSTADRSAGDRWRVLKLFTLAAVGLGALVILGLWP